jgi:UDP-N-acetylmuramate dehydrogenase
MYRNYALSRHNTFGLDVTAAWAVKIPDLKDLEKIRKEFVFRTEKHMILGGGSNCLFLDDYFEGIVLLVENKGISIINESSESVVVSVAAGEDWTTFVEKMINSGYGGLENLSLIPGKVGAAPMQNIGAYGVELKDVFTRLQAFDLETGELADFDKDACDFGYRSSIFKTSLKNRFVILSVEFLLQKNPILKLDYGSVKQELERSGIVKPGIKEVSQAIINIRRSKLPDPAEIGNAGSFFKNPVVHNLVFNDLKSEYPDIVGYSDNFGTTKLAAGWLIEKAGWKGYRSGDAGVHQKQALVLVNYGKATGRDIYGLAMQIQHSVKEKFGVLLEPEVNLV